MPDMELQDYIVTVFPEGLSYHQAAQLCLHLYCTVDLIPSALHTQCNKDNLALVFSRLVGSGFVANDAQLLAARYGANFHAINEKGHWVEVIASIFKKGDTVDTSMRELLAKRLTMHLNNDAPKDGAHVS
jgi:hypothetical protein